MCTSVCFVFLVQFLLEEGLSVGLRGFGDEMERELEISLEADQCDLERCTQFILVGKLKAETMLNRR